MLRPRGYVAQNADAIRYSEVGIFVSATRYCCGNLDGPAEIARLTPLRRAKFATGRRAREIINVHRGDRP